MNLFGNSLKFTEQGTVHLKVSAASTGWNPHHDILNQAQMVVAPRPLRR